MSDATSLRQALLDLGLEDLIPLPEIPTAEEIHGVLRRGAAEDLATALVELLRESRIQIWSGHWSQDPEVVDSVTAEELLRIAAHYEFNSPADQRLRVYYVNVDNLRVREERHQASPDRVRTHGPRLAWSRRASVVRARASAHCHEPVKGPPQPVAFAYRTPGNMFSV